jgi:hypothetical protein
MLEEMHAVWVQKQSPPAPPTPQPADPPSRPVQQAQRRTHPRPR